MEELNELWKELEVTEPKEQPSLTLPNEVHISASEQIMNRFKKKLTVYLVWNQLLAGFALGLAVANYDNYALLFFLLLTSLILVVFSFNSYRTKKKLEAKPIDFTANLKTAAKQLLQIIQNYIAAEVKISYVLTPFSVILGTMIMLSFRKVPLQNVWQDSSLLYAIIGTTIVVTLLNFFFTPMYLQKKQKQQIFDLQSIIKEIEM